MMRDLQSRLHPRDPRIITRLEASPEIANPTPVGGGIGPGIQPGYDPNSEFADIKTALGEPMPLLYGPVHGRGNLAILHVLSDKSRVAFILLGEGELDGCDRFFINNKLIDITDTTLFHFHSGKDSVLGAGMAATSTGGDQKVDAFWGSLPPVIVPVTFNRMAYVALKVPADAGAPTADLQWIGDFRGLKVRQFDNVGVQTAYSYSDNYVWQRLDMEIRSRLKRDALVNTALTADEKARIDFASWKDAADYCDYDIGGGEKRFAGGTAWPSRTKRAELEAQLDRCCRGYKIEANGKLYYYIDQPKTYCFLATNNMLVPGSFKPNQRDVSEAANQFIGHFADTNPRKLATCTNIVRDGAGTVTVTTSAAHGLTGTQNAEIYGSSSVFDIGFVIVAVPSTTTFTFAMAGAALTVAAAGKVGVPEGRFMTRDPIMDHRQHQLAFGQRGVGLSAMPSKRPLTLNFGNATFTQVNRLLKYIKTRLLGPDDVTPYVAPWDCELDLFAYCMSPGTGSGGVDVPALALLPGDIVRISPSISEEHQGDYEIDDSLFQPDFSDSGSGAGVISLKLKQYISAAFTDVADSEPDLNIAPLVLALGTAAQAPPQVTGVSATENPTKQYDRTLSLVSVSWSGAPAGGSVEIWIKGYKANTGYEMAVGGKTSPAIFMLETTQEVITIKVVAISADGTPSYYGLTGGVDNATVPSTTVLLDGVTSGPSAPSVSVLQHGIPGGFEFTFDQLPNSQMGVVVLYRIYRYTSNSSGSAVQIAAIPHTLAGTTPTHVFQDIIGPENVERYYWVTAVDNQGNESAKTAAFSGTQTSGLLYPITRGDNLIPNGNFDSFDSSLTLAPHLTFSGSGSKARATSGLFSGAVGQQISVTSGQDAYLETEKVACVAGKAYPTGQSLIDSVTIAAGSRFKLKFWDSAGSLVGTADTGTRGTTASPSITTSGLEDNFLFIAPRSGDTVLHTTIGDFSFGGALGSTPTQVSVVTGFSTDTGVTVTRKYSSIRLGSTTPLSVAMRNNIVFTVSGTVIYFDGSNGSSNGGTGWPGETNSNAISIAGSTLTGKTAGNTYILRYDLATSVIVAEDAASAQPMRPSYVLGIVTMKLATPSAPTLTAWAETGAASRTYYVKIQALSDQHRQGNSSDLSGETSIAPGVDNGFYVNAPGGSGYYDVWVSDSSGNERRFNIDPVPVADNWIFDAPEVPRTLNNTDTPLASAAPATGGRTGGGGSDGLGTGTRGRTYSGGPQVR